MKKLLFITLFLFFGIFAFQKGRHFGAYLHQSLPLQFPETNILPEVFKMTKTEGPSPQKWERHRTWTCVDGSTIDAVLLAADAKIAQMRLLKTQRVHTVKLDLLAEKERQRIRDWIQTRGQGGVAGHPIRLKRHRWPGEWRGKDSVSLERTPDTNLWKSPHFDIANEAGVNRDALESIASICESVDGALNALPLPLPVNWGRAHQGRRKIVIERVPPSTTSGIRAGYWDGRTGIVHIDVNYLFEHDQQLVVFEFDKPQRRQKYDTIVHEVTHQSTAALQYLDVPTWVPEGIAEYLAAMQHAPSIYFFGNTHVSTKYHINKLITGDRIIKDRKMHFTHLKYLMNRDIDEWNTIAVSDGIAGRLQYDESLLLIDYFFHCDHSDGLFFRHYLEAVLSGVPEKEARSRYLLRGRSYEDLEKELIDRWKGLGFTINFQRRGEIRDGDATVDWQAEDIKRSMAARRMMMGE